MSDVSNQVALGKAHAPKLRTKILTWAAVGALVLAGVCALGIGAWALAGLGELLGAVLKLMARR
jgi:hypothetical protein